MMKFRVSFSHKQITSVLLAVVAVSALCIQPVHAQMTLDPEIPVDYDMFLSNDIIWYDPNCQPGGSQPSEIIQTGVAAKSLEQFVDLYGQAAFDIGKKYGIPYEAILAQAVLESGMGSSQLTLQANNFFGIKAGTGWTGPTISFPTQEQDANGNTYTVNAAFRKYASPTEGFEGYGQFITQNSRYKPALAFPGDPIAYIKAIKDAGYATDVAYVSKVGGIALSIAEYIKKTGKWPPSSEVAKSNSPTPIGESPGIGQTGGCTSEVGDGSTNNLVQESKGLAWPNKGKHNGTTKSLARDTYQIAMPKFNNYENASEAPWSDCGVFVATAVRASGIDPNYQGRGTSLQMDYVRRNSTKYTVENFTDTAQLKEGQILISPQHTFIYTGNYTGDDGVSYNITQASLYDHPPEAGNVVSASGGYILVSIK